MLDEIEQTQQQIQLHTPASLLTMLPAHAASARRVESFRTSIKNIMHGADDRLLVVSGPCSIHDVDAALDYAELLMQAAKDFSDTLFIVMRVYFEKPRTTLGWKGLISDPKLDGSFDFNVGLQQARKLLLQLTEMNVPAGTEFLDTIIPQYLSDLISWCAIGARTSESQIHRELASSLPLPVGFKNSTDGNIQIAIDAVHTANYPHHLVSINQHGLPSAIKTMGNQHCHVILRGSNEETNYAKSFVDATINNLQREKLFPRLMIDCSHGNSMKHASNQLIAAHAVTQQIAEGSRDIFGIMLESNLTAGKQKFTPGATLRYGQSITDECISWQETLPVLHALADSVKQRRRHFF